MALGKCIVAAITLTCGSLFSAETFTHTLDVPHLQLEAVTNGYTRAWVADADWLPDFGAVGSPALPRRHVALAVPDRMCLSNLTCAVTWRTRAASVRLMPMAEPVRVGDAAPALREDAAVYTASAYPARPIAQGAEQILNGVRLVPVAVTPWRWNPQTGLLEEALAFTLTATFADAPAARSYPLVEGLAETVRQAVVNPDAVGERRVAAPLKAMRALSCATASAAADATERADYLLLSPPDFVSDWEWYVRERAKVHSNVVFKVKNTAEIYAEHPFGEGQDCRNAAESIHAYLRQHRTTMGFQYVVLGGAWLDAQNRKGTTPHFYGGEEMSLSNCVPGVYGYPREDWREIPSDMFYACLDIKESQTHKYPWDANGDNIYIDQNDCSQNDLMPDVVVTRITLNPYRPDGLPAYNRHVLVTNYVEKLRRGEDRNFAGHFRYGLAPDSTGSRRMRANGDRMWYDELEFYDNMYNMFDPRHANQIEDNEVEPRRRIKEQFAVWRPVMEAKGMMCYTWTKGFDTLSEATHDYYASDRDYGFVYSHGWAQGATHFQAGQFATCRGLTLLNGSNGPCDTGYVDYHVTMNGTLTLQYNLGDSGVTNPDGGALASINNTRWGWAGGSATSQPFDSSMSYFMLNRSLVGFNQLYLDVGHAWLKGVTDYASFSYTQGGGTHTWTLTEQICYGDPLVRLPAPEDRHWNGGADGVWDSVTPNWTNALDNLQTYYAASNVYFTVTTDTTVVVREPVGALRLSIPVYTQAVFTLNGESNGNLRVMKALDVAGGDLRLNVGGGVGHDGITLTKQPWNTHDPILTFAGTDAFYVSKVTGAGRIELQGGGVTLDADLFPTPAAPLVFDGPGINYLPTPNELRSRVAGGLTRFGSLAMTNTYVKLATADGFGRSTPLTHTLVSSKLEIAANAFYQRKGAYKTDGYAEKLCATFDVGGHSEVTTSEGGLWTVAQTTTFNLETNATLTLSAETVDCGGAIIINGTNGTASVKTASSLSGQVKIGSGVTLVLDELPLAQVTSLTIDDGAAVVLPESKSGYWQILPVSSHLNCGEHVPFYTIENRVTPLDGNPSLAGAFFRKGALYEWQTTDTHWTSALAHSEPKVLFGDLPTNRLTVAVDLAVSPDFVSYANTTTAYHFVASPTAASASLTFSNIILNGPTTFDLPVAVTEYVEILGGETSFRKIVAPSVRVKSGAALVLDGSHWTRFILEEGAVLKAQAGRHLDWNADTEIDFAATEPIVLDLTEFPLGDEPTVLISGRGHTWTVADLAHFETVGPDAELRIQDGALAVVRGNGLESPYTLTFGESAHWDSSDWCATNKPFAANWSACTLDIAADMRLQPTSRVSRLRLDCAVVGERLAVACASNAIFTLEAAADASLDVDTIDLTDAHGEVTLDVATGDALIRTPSDADATCTLSRRGSGTLDLQGANVNLAQTGAWTLKAGAQGVVSVTLPPTNRVVTLVHLEEAFEYPSGGFDIQVVDADGAKRTDCFITRTANELVAVPSVLDVGDVDFETLIGNAIQGAPYSHWLVHGSLSGTVTLTNLPSVFGGATNVTVDSGTDGLRLVVNVATARLGSVSVNFAGGRDKKPDVAESRVTDNAAYMLSEHGVHPIVGTNWNDIAAANGTYAATRLVRRDGTVETNGAITVKLTQVANPYTTGRDVGDRILYGYIDDSQHPIVELAGIPFARYRIIAYRSTDHANVNFSSVRIGRSSADALAYYGSSARGRKAVPTLSGSVNYGWGDTNVRDVLLEGVNYVVSDVLTGGTAYIHSPKHEGRACLAAIQILEVAGDVEEPEEPETAVLEVGTAAQAEDLAASDYAGDVRLLNGVTNELHKMPAYTLTTGSVGRIEVRLTQAPTANGTWLVRTADGFDPAREQVEVVLRDQFGAEFLAPVSVRWKEGGYYLLVQNLDAPAYRHTFTGTVTDPNWNSTGLPETSDPANFEKCREDGQALINWYRGSTRSSLMEPFPTSWTLNMVARTPNNRNGVLFAFGYGAYTPKGFAFVSDGTDKAAVVVWNGWNEAYRLSASVSLATTQYHAYTLTYDGARLALYVDGALAASAADAEGFTYVNGSLNDKIGWFQFWGVCSGKYPAGMSGASGGAMDDWSFYRTCLTPESVRALAARFPVWPQTTEIEVHEPNVSWREAKTWTPEVEDWANVRAAQVVGKAEGASLVCDEPAFGNTLVVAGGVRLVATNTLGFALAPYPVGGVDFTLDDLSQSRRLVNTTTDYVCDDTLFDITVKGINGEPPPEPWFVTRYTDGWYWLRLQDVDAPQYSLDFNGKLTTGLAGTAQPALKDTDNARFVAARGNAGGALTGRNPYVANGLGMPSSWTIHTVAKMPAAANGVIFAYGQKNQGLALYAPTEDTVAVGYWWSGARQGDFVTAVVTNAQAQFHAYGITHTGSRLALWVDGVKRGEASAAGFPNNGNAQFFSVHGGMPTGFANGQDGAIDDWRFFSECLGPQAIARLAAQFQPWPEYRHTRLTDADATWHDLTWAGAEEADRPLLLRVAGGSLAVDKPLDLTSELVVSGGELPVTLTGEGLIRSDAGMTFSAGCTIDASALDGTNMARYAVAGAPYVRWLVRGAYASAVEPRVVALPKVPARYAIRSENVANCGIRLVITAPPTAMFDAISVNIGSDDLAAQSGTLGLYPDTAAAWHAYADWSTEAAPFGAVSVAALPMNDGKIDPETTGLVHAPLILNHTSFDGNGPAYDGLACGYVVSNLTRFAGAYRVLVYMASNTEDCRWGPVEIGERLYTGVQSGAEIEYASVSDSTLLSWGKRFAAPREGVNVVISDVLTNDVIRLVGHRNYAANKTRGQIAAFQIVKVGEVFASPAVDYAATLTNDTAWADGAGEGLRPSDAESPWVNDAISTITLTQDVADAHLVFDTAVTAKVLCVVSEVGQTLRLSASTADARIAQIDLSDARGKVILQHELGASTLVAGRDTVLQLPARGAMACSVASGMKLTLNTNLLFNVAGDALASGGHLRYLGPIADADLSTYLPSAGMYGFERATVTGDLKGEDVAKRKIVVEEGDEVMLKTSNSYGCVDLSVEVRGGHLTYVNSTVWIGYFATYLQTGGLVTFGTDDAANILIPGYTGNYVYTMNISGGTTDVSRMEVKFDQKTAINVSGSGVLKVKKFTENRNTTHIVSLTDHAVLDMWPDGWSSQPQSLTLKGGIRIDGCYVPHDDLFAHACSTSHIAFSDTAERVDDSLVFGGTHVVRVPAWYDATLTEGELALALNSNAIPPVAAQTVGSSLVPALALEDGDFKASVPTAVSNLWYRLVGYETPDAPTPSHYGEWTSGANGRLACPQPAPTKGFFRVQATDVPNP